MKDQKNRNESMIEGRNAVLEAFRSGKPVDKLYVLDGCQDGPVRTIVREAKKHDTILNFVTKERLDQLSETKKHQGVIAVTAAYEYSDIEDMFNLAKKKGEDPFPDNNRAETNTPDSPGLYCNDTPEWGCRSNISSPVSAHESSLYCELSLLHPGI